MNGKTKKIEFSVHHKKYTSILSSRRNRTTKKVSRNQPLKAMQIGREYIAIITP